jgi:hypothetical protein
VHLCAFFAASVVKFYHRGRGGRDTEANIIWYVLIKLTLRQPLYSINISYYSTLLS